MKNARRERRNETINIYIGINVCSNTGIPVAAVTYSDEYYKMGNITSTPWNKIASAYWGGGQEYPTSEYLTLVELRRQTILMEKQNELLEEQNGLLRTQMGMKLKCTDLNVGVCGEYEWVAK